MDDPDIHGNDHLEADDPWADVPVIDSAWDLDGTGTAEWDTTGDGMTDFVEHDDSGDGRVDRAEIDLDHDGVLDRAGLDTTDDGTLDTVIDLAPPPSPPAPEPPPAPAEANTTGSGGGEPAAVAPPPAEAPAVEPVPVTPVVAADDQPAEPPRLTGNAASEAVTEPLDDQARLEHLTAIGQENWSQEDHDWVDEILGRGILNNVISETNQQMIEDRARREREDAALAQARREVASGRDLDGTGTIGDVRPVPGSNLPPNVPGARRIR